MSDARPAPVPPVRLAVVGDEAGPDLDSQLAAVGRLGWDLVELRNVDGQALADLPAAAFARLVDRLAAAGVGTVCVDSRIANWARPVTGPLSLDLAELHVLAERCPALGTRYVRVMSYPNDGLADADWGREAVRRLRLLTERAADAGLVLLHENCSGWAGRDADRVLQLLAEVDSPALGLVFDTGNGVEYGYDAYELLAELVAAVPEKIRHVQVKDAAGTADRPDYCWPGEGRCRVAECLRLLLDRGYRGVVSAEPHLLVRPHAGAGPPAGAPADGVATVVEYGRRLAALVAGAGRPGGVGAGAAR
ncbi:MAG TPA: sugar phosphate isomerase/epimerase family protein [Mycobacteriales bacterium]|nr:sugar phosphate isomerase/epimerase family protein [Mycobacteriales bacterium]